MSFSETVLRLLSDNNGLYERRKFVAHPSRLSSKKQNSDQWPEFFCHLIQLYKTLTINYKRTASLNDYYFQEALRSFPFLLL